MTDPIARIGAALSVILAVYTFIMDRRYEKRRRTLDAPPPENPALTENPEETHFGESR